MKAKFVCLILFAFSISSIFAYNYHFSALYDAFGPVKEIKTDSKNPFVKKKVKFEKDGRGGVAVMSYNDDGFPTGFEVNMFGKSYFQKFFWNDKCRLDSVAVQTIGVSTRQLITVKNSYCGDVADSETIIVNDGEIQKKYRMSFKDYSYDNQGNWISRFVVLSTIDSNGKESVLQFEETRIIKYYVPDNRE